MQYWRLPLSLRRNSLACIAFCTPVFHSGAIHSINKNLFKHFHKGGLSGFLFPGALGCSCWYHWHHVWKLMKTQIQLGRGDEEKRDSKSGWILLSCSREEDCDVSLITAVEEMKYWLQARTEPNMNMKEINIILITTREKQMWPPPLSVDTQKALCVLRITGWNNMRCTYLG